MKRRLFIPVVLIGAAFLLIGARSAVEGAKPDEKAIRDTAAEFTAAFNKGDARALADMWTLGGRLVLESGELIKGRGAIERGYARFFKGRPGARIEIGITSIEFPSDTTAIEDGVSTSTAKGEFRPSVGRYTAVHVFKDGKWLMATVTESAANNPAERASMNDLSWMIGTWEAKHEKTVIRSKVKWLIEKTFIGREYTVENAGALASSGFQIIGYDPQTGHLRSWSFDATGGHGAGFWSPSSDGWRIESVGTLADGTPTSSLDFLIRVPGEDNVVGWRSVNRHAGAKTLPNPRELVLDRVPEKR